MLIQSLMKPLFYPSLEISDQFCGAPFIFIKLQKVAKDLWLYPDIFPVLWNMILGEADF